MYASRLLLFCVILFAISSCKVQNGNTKLNVKQTETAFLKDGYEKAVVLFFPEKKEDCRYLIRLENEQMLETFDLPDAFKKNGVQVWLKFGAQKRMSLCEGSTPVAIIDIKKREE